MPLDVATVAPDVEVLPTVISPNRDMGLAPPIELPPIQLQPDPPRPAEWVPTAIPMTIDDRLTEQIAVAVPMGTATVELTAEPVSPRARSTRVATGGRRPRPRVRRVTRVIRHVDPWSVFKVALCFSFVLYGICLTAAVLLWNVAYTTGTIDNLEKFFEAFGWSSFQFKGGELFHNLWIAGLFGALGLTGLALLTATLFNLIADLVGGVRVTVLEEEVVERTPQAARPLLRGRFSRPPKPPVAVNGVAGSEPG